jgi:small subunit ribosomal protein S8
MTDPIADMLTRIRNAVAVQRTDVMVPFSNLKFSIAKILEKEGFIISASPVDATAKQIKQFNIVLKYKKGQPVVRGISRISRPGRRVYYNDYFHIPRIDDQQRGKTEENRRGDSL